MQNEGKSAFQRPTIALNDGELSEHQASAVAVMDERHLHYSSPFRSL